MPDEPPSLCLAPLRGVTALVFRRCFTRHFGGFDFAVAPFLTTVAGTRIKATHLADIDPGRNRDLPLVPQVIGKSAPELRTLLLAIRGLGYARADLNAGCPWPMIVKKGRGAGLLRDADALRRMLEVGCDILPGASPSRCASASTRPTCCRRVSACSTSIPCGKSRSTRARRASATPDTST